MTLMLSMSASKILAARVESGDPSYVTVGSWEDSANNGSGDYLLPLR